MLQLTPQTRIFLAIEPADFRCGIDGLAALCRKQLQQDPFSGCVFVFRNRRRTALKILFYDSQGFWLCQKRFSKGKIRWWPKSSEASTRIKMNELQVLLWNGNPTSARMAEEWRSIE